MQSINKVQEVTNKGSPMGDEVDNLTPEDVLKQAKADFKAAKKESRQMAKDQKKAERKEFNDKFKTQQQELRQAHRDAKKQLKDQFQSETAGMHVFPQEKEEEAKESEEALKQERNEAFDQFKKQQKELNADFKAKKQALKQEIREAKAVAFGRKLKTPEQEKEALEKKIAKLQAKFMELYGETPEGDSNDEVDKTEGELINHPFQAVKAN